MYHPNPLTANLYQTWFNILISTPAPQLIVCSTHFGADYDDFSSLCCFLDFINTVKIQHNLKIETHICLSGNLETGYLDLTPEHDFMWKDETLLEFETDLNQKLNLEVPPGNFHTAVFGCSDFKRAKGNPFLKFVLEHKENPNTSFYTLNFDHHVGGDNWASFNLVDDEASSNAENVLDILTSYSDYRPSPSIASNLMVGLVSDTVNFFANSTTDSTHTHAGQLMSYGCNIAQVREIINAKWTSVNLNRLNVLIQQTVYIRPTFAILDCSKDSEIAGLFSNEILDILKTEVVIMIKEGLDITEKKLSIRCLPRSPINAVELARHFGGGGHRLAAGATIDNFNSAEFTSQLENLLQSKLEN